MQSGNDHDHHDDDDDVHKSMLKLTLSRARLISVGSKSFCHSKFSRQDARKRWRRARSGFFSTASCRGCVLPSHSSAKWMRCKSFEHTLARMLNYSNWPRAHGHVQRPAEARERTPVNCMQSHCFGQWVNDNSNGMCMAFSLSPSPPWILVSVEAKTFDRMCVAPSSHILN